MSELLRQILARSLAFDVETGGMDPFRHPLVEGAVYDFRTGQVRQAIFEHGIRTEGVWQPLTEAEFLARMEPWSRQRFAPGESWHGFLRAQKQRPDTWLAQQLVNPVRRGAWLWAHNARFDLRFLAANLPAETYQQLISSIPDDLLSKTSRVHGRLHVTGGRETFRILQQSRLDPRRTARYFVQSWEPFVQTLQRAAEQGHGLLLDTQYVMQVALAYAQEAGYMRPTQDVFTGTSVAAAKMALQRPVSQAHTAAADVMETGAILENYLPIIERLRQGQPLTPAQQRIIAFHERLQPLLFPENARIQFMRARQELLHGRPYQHYSTALGQRYSWNFSDILNIYQRRAAIYGYSADLRRIHQQVAAMSLEDIEAQLLSHDERLQTILQEAWETTTSRWQWLRRSRLQTLTQWVSRHPGKTLAAGLTAFAVWRLSRIPGRDDAYNTIEGLPHGWYGSQRFQTTDFASGYQDSQSSQGWLQYAWSFIKSHKFAFGATVGAAGLSLALKRYNPAWLQPVQETTERWASLLLERAEGSPWWSRLPLQAAADVIHHPAALVSAAAAAFTYEGFVQDKPVTARDIATTAAIVAVDVVDDVAWLAQARVLERFLSKYPHLSERLSSHPAATLGGKLFKATVASAFGYAAGKMGGLFLRWRRQREQRRRQQLSPQRTANLVQTLHRARIGHFYLGAR